MADLDPLDHIIQNFRCQLLNGCVFADSGVHFPALHAFGKGLYLLQHIGIEHIVVDPVGFGANLRVGIVVHAEVNIRLSAFQLLSGNLQRVSAAFTEDLSPEQIESLVQGGAAPSCANLLYTLKLRFLYDGFVGIGGHGLPLRGNRGMPLCLIVGDFRFQINQCAGVDRIF